MVEIFLHPNVSIDFFVDLMYNINKTKVSEMKRYRYVLLALSVEFRLRHFCLFFAFGLFAKVKNRFFIPAVGE